MNRFSLLCVPLALTLLTGCAAPPETSGVPEPPQEAAKFSPSVREDAQATDLSGDGFPVLPEGRTAPGATVDYTQDLPITVDGGRGLTLRLRCRAVSSGYGAWTHGVGSMDVLEGDDLLQTVLVEDAIRAAEAAEGLDSLGGDGWTSCFEGLHLPEIGDLNFDGADDIRLMEFLGAVNGRYLHWLWDPETEQFVYAFCLVGYDFSINRETKQLVTEARDGGGSYCTNYYRYDDDGALQHVREERQQLLNEGGPAVLTVHELIGGEWIQTSQEKSP